MQHYFEQQYAYAAESMNSAFCAMSASDAYTAKTLAAIIFLMAVVLFTSSCGMISPIISITIIILGIIVRVIVRRFAKPVSRTK